MIRDSLRRFTVAMLDRATEKLKAPAPTITPATTQPQALAAALKPKARELIAEFIQANPLPEPELSDDLEPDASGPLVSVPVVNLPDDDEDDDGWSAQPETAATVIQTRHEILTALGIQPIPRPMWNKAIKGDGDGMVETNEPALDSHGNPIPLDDVHFAELLKRAHTPNFGHLAGIGGPESGIDVITQLPTIRSNTKVSFFPSISKKGEAASWIGPSATPADLALAAIGWVRYVAHGGGERDNQDENNGTFYEGFVPITKNAKKPAEAVAIARAHHLNILARPTACVRGGVLFGNRPAPWLLLRVKPALKKRLDEMGMTE